jgi:guanidinopropionase
MNFQKISNPSARIASANKNSRSENFGLYNPQLCVFCHETMTTKPDSYKPISGNDLPRFAGIATFMRALYRNQTVGMVHFDAHTDTLDRYFGESKYTHGTPFRRAIEEGLLDPKRTVQIGIRGALYSNRDKDWGLEQGIRVIEIEECHDLGIDGVIAEARRVVGTGPTYLSFDVDALDPVYAPGTGTPEIGGLTTYDAQQMLRGMRGLNLVGGDVVEVSPPFDMSGNTALVAVTMMFEILCLLAENVGQAKRG